VGTGPDDLRINPYAGVTDRVTGVRDHAGKKHRREEHHHHDDPVDVVEIDGVEEQAAVEEPDNDTGFDLSA
jgi:hypothetical protein